MNPRVMNFQDKKSYHKKEEPLSDSEQLSIAMWFIRKIGNPDQAMKALYAASLALEELKKK